MHVAVLNHVGRTYHLDAVAVPALTDINLEIQQNCFTVISGPSGSGKTALLNIIGCIDQPDSGDSMNCTGGIDPSSALCQRSNASTPVSASLARFSLAW
jgi:ABC-type lipoprotein export system ATPase subunit